MPDRQLILDTCALLWLASGDARLSRPTIREIDAARSVQVSAISAWEISLKVAMRHLELPLPATEWFAAALRQHGLTVAPLDVEVLMAANDLPWHHRDPADRFIIATAKRHSLTIVTGDQRFELYGIPVIC
jgi:PIN domain nuclease of toxin-antitoxin system